MPILTLQDIHKDFGEGDVLRGISLSVEQGEFMTLLGPSGCGKTTLLRIIAGLESPKTGRVWLNGRDVTALPPEKRNVNTVFQNYALFPHMNVYNNIAYGLKLRGLTRADIRKKVGEMLAFVQLEGYEKRMPAQLSGGQRQRVAIARAVVLEPSILLLDEPLGALDLQLRRAMQLELKRIQTQLDIAFVYITHDQEEALNMSDRIAVMREGRIEQYGTPEEIYEHPKTRFAAGFIGQTNLLEATVVERAEGGRLKVRYGQTVLPAFGQAAVGSRVALCLRMERVRYGSQPQGCIALPGRLVERQYAGGSLRSTIALTDGRQLVAIGQDEFGGTIGEETLVWWDPKLVPVVPEEAAS